MLDILRKKSRNSFITRIVLSVIVIVILLAISDFAIFDVITGPTKIDLTASPDDYNNKYVTVEVENVLTDYVEHTTTTTNTRTGSKSTSVDGNSYIVFNAKDDYENSTSTWYYYSIYMGKNQQSIMYDRIDDTWAYWNDETGTVNPPEPFTVTGTWTKLDTLQEKYYRETMAEMGITEGEFDIVEFYTIDTAKIGGLNNTLFWVLMLVVLFFLVFLIISVVGIFGNSYLANVTKYIQANTSVSLATIESDFSQAHQIGKYVWVGKRWTIYMEGSKAKIIDNKELIWGYYYKQTGRYSVSQIRLYTTAKKMIPVNMSENLAHEALKYYAEEQPQMITGYSSDLEKTYQKQFTEFLNIKYNPAKNAEQTDPYFNSSYYDMAGTGTTNPTEELK